MRGGACSCGSLPQRVPFHSGTGRSSSRSLLTASASSSTSHYTALCEVSGTPRASPDAASLRSDSKTTSSAPRITPAPWLHFVRRAVSAPPHHAPPRDGVIMFRKAPHHAPISPCHLRLSDVESCPRRLLSFIPSQSHTTPAHGVEPNNADRDGITEGFHRKMKLIQHRAYGFRNFENYRLRVIAQCG